MFIVSVTEKLKFTHSLPGYPPYDKPHNHEWHVTVRLKKDCINEIGISYDFLKVREELKKILDELQGENLNKHKYFKNAPTAERIAMYVYENFPFSVVEVEVGDDKEFVIFRK